MLDVGRSAFLLFQRHEFHPAFRTVSGTISDDFGMHRAGVLLYLVLLLLALMVVVGMLGENRVTPRHQNGARDYGYNVFSHFRLVVGQAPRLPAGKHGNRSGCPTNSTRLRLLYPTKGGACARRLCCKINSANENAPGGPVSSNSGATAGDEYTTNTPV